MKVFRRALCMLLSLGLLAGCAPAAESGGGGNEVKPPQDHSQEPDTPPQTQERVKLMFEIEGGEAGGKELIYKHRDDFDALDAVLDNIYNGIKPLREKFDVVVQIYPTWHYKAEGYSGKGAEDPMDRISPELKHTMNYFRRKDVPFYLEIYSSGIRTNQNGELGSIPPAALHYGEEQKYPALPVDMDTLKALREHYDYYFEGLRMHELIGSHEIGLNDQKHDNEEHSHGFVAKERVVKGIVDTVAETGLKLVWSDHRWQNVEKKLLGRDGEFGMYFDEATAREIKGWLDYAVSKLDGTQLTLNWANNGWPAHQFFVEDFLLKNYGGSSYGESVQDWFWQELDSSTMIDQNGAIKWYIDADLDCPPEIMAIFTLRAIQKGAKLIQYEPIQYFFNAYVSRRDSSIPVSGVEDTGDYSPKLTLKRFIDYVLNDGKGVLSTNLTDYYGTDYDKYQNNRESNPPKRYYQNTLFAGNGTDSKVFDKYNNNFDVWHEQSQNRLREYITAGETVSASRLALTFSCGDEFVFAKKEKNGTRLEFYNYRSGRLLAQNNFFADDENGTVVDVFGINLKSEMNFTLGGDPDEIVIVKEKDGTLQYFVYEATAGNSAVTQDFVLEFSQELTDRLYAMQLQTAAQGYMKSFGMRTRNAVLGDMTRPKDTAIVNVYKDGSDLKLSVNGQWKTIGGFGNAVACCPIDNDGDFKDDLAVVVSENGKNTIRFYNIEKETIFEKTEDLGDFKPNYIFGYKIGTYLRGF